MIGQAYAIQRGSPAGSATCSMCPQLAVAAASAARSVTPVSSHEVRPWRQAIDRRRHVVPAGRHTLDGRRHVDRLAIGRIDIDAGRSRPGHTGDDLARTRHDVGAAVRSRFLGDDTAPGLPHAGPMTLTATGFTATSHLWEMFLDRQADETTSVDMVAAGVSDMTAGRLGAIAAAALALIGIFLGGRALARSAGGTGSAPRTSMILGLIAIVLGGLVIATSDGSVGTGNGLGGAIVAIVTGLIALVLGGLARARSRREA